MKITDIIKFPVKYNEEFQSIDVENYVNDTPFEKQQKKREIFGQFVADAMNQYVKEKEYVLSWTGGNGFERKFKTKSKEEMEQYRKDLDYIPGSSKFKTKPVLQIVYNE